MKKAEAKADEKKDREGRGCDGRLSGCQDGADDCPALPRRRPPLPSPSLLGASPPGVRAPSPFGYGNPKGAATQRCLPLLGTTALHSGFMAHPARSLADCGREITKKTEAERTKKRGGEEK